MSEHHPREHPVAPAEGPDPDAPESQPGEDQRERPMDPAEGTEEAAEQ